MSAYDKLALFYLSFSLLNRRRSTSSVELVTTTPYKGDITVSALTRHFNTLSESSSTSLFSCFVHKLVSGVNGDMSSKSTARDRRKNWKGKHCWS